MWRDHRIGGSAVRRKDRDRQFGLGFWLGGIGLNVVQGARLAGATMIIGVDVNSSKEVIARELGATHFVNPREIEKLTSHLMKLTNGGAHESSVGQKFCDRRCRT